MAPALIAPGWHVLDDSHSLSAGSTLANMIARRLLQHPGEARVRVCEGKAPPWPRLFQAPMMDWMTIRGMASGSVQEAPLKATAKWSLGRSGSLTRTSEPVK